MPRSIESEREEREISYAPLRERDAMLLERERGEREMLRSYEKGIRDATLLEKGRVREREREWWIGSLERERGERESLGSLDRERNRKIEKRVSDLGTLERERERDAMLLLREKERYEREMPASIDRER
ncbi:Protein Daple [Manis pentadactyla]|nr:Protein Daple [Manis pentadactyla]